jgi:hypothetical protein
MSKSKQEPHDNMPRDIYVPMRRNLFRHGESRTRHHALDILSGRLEIIRDDTRIQRIE